MNDLKILTITLHSLATPKNNAAIAHQAWWRVFWNRSWIKIDALSGGTALPTNIHTWKLGVDSSGGSRFGGEISGVNLTNKSLDDSEIAALAAAPRPETSATIAGTDVVMGEACTLAAWIKPAVGEAGRILDKCTVGQPDGFTFDMYPGLSLRWIVGNRNLSMPNWLKSGEWQHVAARGSTWQHVAARGGARRWQR